jgi:hypothetical protein
MIEQQSLAETIGDVVDGEHRGVLARRPGEGNHEIDRKGLSCFRHDPAICGPGAAITKGKRQFTDSWRRRDAF